MATETVEDTLNYFSASVEAENKLNSAQHIVYMSCVQIHLIPFFISCVYVFNAFTTVLSFKPNYIINYAYYILFYVKLCNFLSRSNN